MTEEEIKEYWRTAYCNEKHKKEELEAQIEKIKSPGIVSTIMVTAFQVYVLVINGS